MWNAVDKWNRQRPIFCRRIQLLLLIGLLSLLSAGCQRVDPVIKVGLVAPFEGRHRAVGYDVLYSARLAVREQNAAGGIGGTRIALVALDDSGNPEFAGETADSLIVDPAVVAVVGHWVPETTTVAKTNYSEYGLAFLAGSEAPFQATDPRQLPADFVAAYTAVTPFNEHPGPYAEPAYEAYQYLWQVLSRAQEQYGTITRTTVLKALSELE